MGNIEKYLNKIVDYMVRHSKDNQFPFDTEKYSFSKYCKNQFGLTEVEVRYVYYKYRYLVGWDSHDRSSSYLHYVLNKWLLDNG